MIAKAAAISHGGNAMRYVTTKDRSDIVMVNHLPDDISPDAMYQRMLLHQKMLAKEVHRGRPLMRNMIRIELSPDTSESRGWTLEEWRKLAEEFIRTFDGIDMSKRTRRKSSQRTNLRNSQFVVALHRDAKSGIFHLHVIANRIDMEGNTNDAHKIGERAVAAANIINGRRGWVQSAEIGQRHRQEVGDALIGILRGMDKFSWKSFEMEVRKKGYGIHIQQGEDGKVYGYSIMRGNSRYKASELGRGRNLTASKIEGTWAKLHPQERKCPSSKTIVPKTGTAVRQSSPQRQPLPVPSMRHYDISTDSYHTYHIELSEEADRIIRQECSLAEAHPLATIEEIQHTAILLFAEYLDAATSMATSSGGGGNSDSNGWGRNKDEDDREWARRCARKANSMCKRRKGLKR